MSDRPARILIVDDEVDLVSVLRFGLELEGFEVIDAFDGETGLKRAQEDHPDLIVLDLMLPRMDGYKVCRTLKFDQRFQKIPILILSARSGESDKRLAMDMGADAFVTKPYEMQDLVSRIRVQLNMPPQRKNAAA